MVVHVDGAGAGPRLHGEAVIVLETVVLVPGEHHPAGPGDPAALREEVWLGRGQDRPRPRRGLARSAKHLSERVRGQTSAHHVTQVTVAEPCGGEGRRRGVIVVATVTLRGERGVVRLRGPASVAAACRRNGGGVACLGLGWRLAVVQVGVRGGLWGLRGPFVWGQKVQTQTDVSQCST